MFIAVNTFMIFISYVIKINQVFMLEHIGYETTAKTLAFNNDIHNKQAKNTFTFTKLIIYIYK